MTDVVAFDELRSVVQRHHVHFEVRPEVYFQGDTKTNVGFEVRLWTVHDKGAHAAPGCEKCHGLLAELDRIVEWALPEDDRPTRIEIERPGPILYESREVPDTDEVALTLRLTHREAYDGPVDACEERCLKHLRERFRKLGIPER